MAQAVFTIKMEECMMVNGSLTKWKGLEDFIINQISQHMKANGKKTNSQEKESYTIKNLKF